MLIDVSAFHRIKQRKFKVYNVIKVINIYTCRKRWEGYVISD